MYQRPDRSYFQEPPELESLGSTGKLIQNFLPKQADRQTIKNNTKKSSERNTFTCTCEGNTGRLLNQLLLLRIYICNKLPSTTTAIQKVEMLPNKFILLDSSLFKLVTTPEKETALFAIPETCATKIITLYHSSLFVGHQGVIKHI